MKTNFQYLVIFLAAAAITAGCGRKNSDKDATASKDEEKWTELESFHQIMADAFHPFKDSSDLAPAKKLARDLAKESSSWAEAALPKAVDNEKVKAKLEKLKTDCRDLAALVDDGAPDDQIGTALNTTHDSFHAVMEEWHKGKEHSR